MTPVHKIKLDTSSTQALTFETCPAALQIDGVWFHFPKKNRSENGAFMEYLRLGEEDVQYLPGPLTPRKISVSWAAAGRINTIHTDVKQEHNEIWCVLGGQLTIWLVDCRVASLTRNVKRELVFSSERPLPVHIPGRDPHCCQAGHAGATLIIDNGGSSYGLREPGVASGRVPGVICSGIHIRTLAAINKAMDVQFDSNDPNEGRLPWDGFGRSWGPKIWGERRGERSLMQITKNISCKNPFGLYIS